MEDAHYIKSPKQVRLVPGAAAAIKRLNDARIKVIVATNQSGIARGKFTVGDYEAVRARFEALLLAGGARVDASYYCPHYPSITGPCNCRKPGLKMFTDGMRDFLLDANDVAYIGDRWRDVTAATKLGGRGIMVTSPMTTDADRRLAQEEGIETADSITQAVDMLFALTDGHGPA